MLDQLIKKCLKNNILAQKELYNNYKDNLFVLCLKYCANREDAQDVLQDTFLEVFQNLNKFQNKVSFEGWMKRIAINKSISKYKQFVKNEPFQDQIHEVLEVEWETETFTSDEILKVIQDLPNQYRLVFNLYELDDLSHQEISSLLGISEGTSKSNLHRAKQLLQKKLNEIKNGK